MYPSFFFYSSEAPAIFYDSKNYSNKLQFLPLLLPVPFKEDNNRLVLHLTVFDQWTQSHYIRNPKNSAALIKSLGCEGREKKLLLLDSFSDAPLETIVHFRSWKWTGSL